VDENAVLAAVRDLVTREPSLAVVLAQVARLLADALAADGCLVYRVEASGELIVAASHPMPLADRDPLRLPQGFGVTGRVAADVIPAILVDDNPRNARHRELLGLQGGDRVSRLCVPARVPEGGCSAVLAVHADKAVVQLFKHGRSVVLSITDDGRGFEASGQLSGMRRGRPTGSQYGLAGMVERVHLIGGKLSVTSAPGEGTTVEVTVPNVV